MSREWLLQTLIGLGLSQTEAKIYLLLSQSGPLRRIEIASTLKLNKKQLCRTLKNLQCKGCVEATLERPTLFSAVLIEKVLNHFMNSKEKQANILQAKRSDLLSAWRSMIEKDSPKG